MRMNVRMCVSVRTDVFVNMCVCEYMCVCDGLGIPQDAVIAVNTDGGFADTV